MNINIRKFGGGGGASPYLLYSPVTVNDAPNTEIPNFGTTAAKTTTAAKSTTGNLTDKDLFSMLKEIDGLPSDMNSLFESISNLYTAPTIDGLNASSINAKYIRILNGVKVAKFNKSLFDEAKKLVTTNGGLNEVAIDGDGRVVVANSKGEISRVTLEDLKSGKYLALSNADLLSYRAYNKSMDPSIINIVANGVGMELVNKYIQSISTKLASSTVGLEGYSKTQEGKIVEGINILSNLQAGAEQNMSLDGVYKSSELTEALKKLAELAVKYIFTTMPTNMKTLLKYKSNGTNEGAYNLICTVINSQMKTSDKYTTNMILDGDGKKPGSKGSGSGSGSGSGHKATLAELFVTGNGSQQEITLNPGTSFEYTGIGVHGQLASKTGEILGANDSWEDVTLSLFAPALDLRNATFGGELINTTSARKLLLRSGDIVGMDIPIDQEAAKSSIIKPDFDSMKKLELAEAIIHQENITDPLKINEIMKSVGLPDKFVYLSGQWVVNKQSFARFGLIHAIGDGSIFSENHNALNNSVAQVTDQSEIDSYLEVIRKNTSNDKYKLPTSGMLWWSENELYSGTIFVPIKNDAIVTLGAAGGLSYETQIKDVEGIQEEIKNNNIRQEVALNFNKAPSLNEIK